VTAAPRWVSEVVVEAIHAGQLREHGGRFGIRDQQRLEVALVAPRRHWERDAESELTRLAAAYGHAIGNGRPFVDGNERVAFVTMVVFLGLNGLGLGADEARVIATMSALVAGELSEEGLARWLASHVVAGKV